MYFYRIQKAVIGLIMPFIRQCESTNRKIAKIADLSIILHNGEKKYEIS